MECYVPRADDLAVAVPASLRWTLIHEVELALLAHRRETPERQLTFGNILLLQHCLKRFLDLADLQRGCRDYDPDSPLSRRLCHTQNERGGDSARAKEKGTNVPELRAGLKGPTRGRQQ